LKDLTQIKEKSVELAFERIRDFIPESFVRNILNRVDRMENTPEIILLAEEFMR